MNEFILDYFTNFLNYLSLTICVSLFTNKSIQKIQKYCIFILISLVSLFAFLLNDICVFILSFIFLIIVNEIFTVTNIGNHILQIMFSFFTVTLLYDMGILFFIILERSFHVSSSPDTKNLLAMLSVIVSVIIYKYILEKCPLGSLSKNKVKYFILFLLLLIADFIISHGFFEYILAQNEVETFFIIDLAYVLISIGFYAELILIIYFMAMNDVHKANARMASMYLEMQKNYYEYLEKREEDTRRFRHDIQSHLTMIRLLYQENRYSEMEHYFDELDVKAASLLRNINVGNEIANALLSYYESYMETKSVHLSVNGYFPAFIPISSYDLCTILSNLLDNALEALYDYPDTTVTINFAYDDNHYMISAQNPCKRKWNHLKILQTTKTDTQNHGYGLKNIETAVHNYQGLINISTENDIFHIDIIIPRNEVLNENCNY